MTDETKNVPKTIRPWAAKLLPALLEFMTAEKGVPVFENDAISIAIKEALERRQNPELMTIREYVDRQEMAEKVA